MSTPNGRPAPTYESVVEFVFGSATLALNIHRLFPRLLRAARTPTEPLASWGVR
ncbi:MAG: hypothetical protein ABSF69_11885 [Polyangiaceae bacterium]